MADTKADKEQAIEFLRERWVTSHREYKQAGSEEDRVAIRDRLTAQFNADCRDVIAKELGLN